MKLKKDLCMENIELINFIKLTLQEKKMILNWRNCPEIRKWMYNENEISLEDHLNFIEHLKTINNKLYFLVKKEDDYIGVIDFTNINNENLEMGIYTNPNLFGYGKILLKQLINYAFNILKVKKIYAEVFAENQKAYNLYKRLYFEDEFEKIVNGKKVIRMELKNENR